MLLIAFRRVFSDFREYFVKVFVEILIYIIALDTLLLPRVELLESVQMMAQWLQLEEYQKKLKVRKNRAGLSKKLVNCTIIKREVLEEKE